MRETIPWGGHWVYDVLVSRRLQRFYDRLASQMPHAQDITDIGCGPGHLAAAVARLHPAAQVVGIDLDPVQVNRARRHHDRDNLRYQEGASHAMPLEAETMDWVLATETFHHWSQPALALQEIHRVLRPGGEFWLVEGAGDMSKRELGAWTGRKPFPGLTWWVRLVFRTHGYTTEALQDDMMPRIRSSPFGDADVSREDGWWIVRMAKT